uniref:Pre-mRNA-processing factor 17 n=1 Tax=Acrobeloides nanus TaxID=290746 RepID=A0A914CI83_9BILA
MDLLKNYADSGSDMDDEPDPSRPISSETIKALALPNLNLTPSVAGHEVGIKKVAVIDPKTKELNRNPKYDELFLPVAGPSNPYKSANQNATKNMLTGFVEPAHVNQFHFDRELRDFDTLGYAKNPSAEGKNEFIGDVEKAKKKDGASLFESVKTGGQKRKRVTNYDASDMDNFTGPWAIYVDEKTVAKPDPELQKEMDEIVRKRKLKSRAGRKAAEAEQHLLEETSTLHIKDDTDYAGRSWMDVPQYTGTNLRADYVPDRCYPPTKQMYTFKGHQKAINAVRWFPKSAHLFLSCAMDSKIKLWELYGGRKCIRTYSGHKFPVRDICFNNDGTEFLSASFDNYVKLWDTEIGKVKNRFNTGSKIFCVKFNPDDDKQNIFLCGLQNKKIIQYDTRTGEIEQEYDRHLGPVNSVTFFDNNRRFCSTSDDKSIRIWEWGIPVDTKLIQGSGLHSIPTMTKAPTEKWICGQSMDNRIVLFQLTDDKLRFARKKAFRGHNVAGYASTIDFSPEMSYIVSGDADGKVFIWDWRTHKIIARWKAHDNVCFNVLWHPHERARLLTSGWDGLIKMWN